MRKLVPWMVVLSLGVPVVAGAHGGRGSYEGDRKHRSGKRYARYHNNVRCGGGMRVAQAGTTFYADPFHSGAEVCKDSGPAPVQGRAIANRSGWVAVDGDRHNASQARGYVRVDRTGPHCSQGKDQDSAHSRTGGKPRTCNGS